MKGKAQSPNYPTTQLPNYPTPNAQRPTPKVFLFLLALLLVVSGSGLLAQPGEGGNGSVTGGNSAPPVESGRIAFEMGLVVLLIFLNAFFAMAEYALITVRRTRIRQLAEEGNRSAMLVEKMLASPTRMQATIQTGLTVIATFSSTIAATTAVEPLTFWLRAHTTGPVSHSAGTIALILVTLPVAVLTLVIGEIAPKSLAVRHSERLALIAVHPMRWLQILLTPAVVVLTVLSNLVVRPFGGTASFTTPAVNEEELKMMVEASEEQGVLQASETEMIHSILDFADTVVRKVMTPRIDMTALDVKASLSELLEKVSASGHSRIPVYEDDLDNITGIVHVKDLLPLTDPTVREEFSMDKVMRPAYFIPENKRIGDLLTEFKRSKQQLAIVRDEYGVTSGLITIEDLLEEIVGDIQDEYDEEEPQVQIVDATTTILDGKMGLHEINDRMGLDLPEDEADTIGGFVFGLLGHQAAQGERISFESLEFVVEATDGRRVTKVRLLRRPEIKPHGSAPPPEEETPADLRGDLPQNGTVETSGVETSPDNFSTRR